VRAISLAFAGFLNRRADALQVSDVVRVLDQFVRVGKGAIAGRTQAYGRACYSWAVRRGRLTTNPFAGLPVAVSNSSRDRVLSDNEIGAIYRGADVLGYPFGPLVRLLMLTAQRRDEVAGMRWSEISDDGTIWTIPAQRAKNGKAHIVHHAPEARGILAPIAKGKPTDLIFTTNGKTAVSGFSKMRTRLAAAIGDTVADDWRLHDIRRTCVTWLAGSGFNTGVADKLLNHQTATGLTTVGAVYQRSQFLPERRNALERWGNHVVACAQGSTEQLNVVPIRRAP
jgi:integrase